MATPVSFAVTASELRAVQKLLESGQRPDFRQPFETRKLNVRIGEGSSEVSFGKTSVSCVTTAKKVPALFDKPNQGIHNLNLSSIYKLDSDFRSKCLSSLRDSLNRAQSFDLESLCIKKGESVWCINTDIVVIENDGSLMQAIQFSLFCSLISLRLPGPRGPRPLAIHHFPFSVTYAVSSDHMVIVDPTGLESQASEAIVTICMNAKGVLCGLYKNGGLALNAQTVNFMIENTLPIVMEWHTAAMNALDKYAPAYMRSVTYEIKEKIKEEIHLEAPIVEENIKEVTQEEEDTEEGLDPTLVAFLGL